jgi:hypothetical protein
VKLLGREFNDDGMAPVPSAAVAHELVRRMEEKDDSRDTERASASLREMWQPSQLVRDAVELWHPDFQRKLGCLSKCLSELDSLVQIVFAICPRKVEILGDPGLRLFGCGVRHVLTLAPVNDAARC